MSSPRKDVNKEGGGATSDQTQVVSPDEIDVNLNSEPTENNVLPADLKKNLAELKKLIKATHEKSQEAVVLEQKSETPPSLHKSIEKRDAAPTLHVLNSILDGPENNIHSALKEFLKTRWDTVQGTYLSYTSVPDSEMTKICCAIANYLSDESNPALSYLMHTVKKTSDPISREDINEIPIDQVIRLHVTSDNNESLIPIALLSYLDLESDINDALRNPFVVDKVVNNVPHFLHLLPAEQERLIHHSLITEEIVSAKESYKQVSSQGASLYSATQELISGLRKGGAHGLGGGTEGAATVAAYKALDIFREFWNQLTLDQKDLACQDADFKKVIDEKICNPLWKDDCVEILAKDLDSIVSKNRDKFVSIGLSQDQQAAILKAHENKFDQAKKDLFSALEFSDGSKSQYQGRDNLFLNMMQIESLVNKDSIKTPEDVLLILKDLHPKEIEYVCDKYKEEFAQAIKDADGLFTIILNLGVQQVEPFSRKMADKINKGIDVHPVALGNALNFLSDGSAVAFLEGAKNSKLISDSIDLKKVLAALSETKFNIFIEKVNISNYIKDGIDFKNIAQVIPENKLDVFLKLMENKLSTLIKSVYDLKYALEPASLSDNHKNNILEKVGDKMLNFIKDSYDFNNLLEVIPNSRKDSFLETVSSAIKNGTLQELKKDYGIMSMLATRNKEESQASPSLSLSTTATTATALRISPSRLTPTHNVDDKKDEEVTVPSSPGTPSATEAMDDDITDEKMANSSFGQSSNSAKKLRH